MSLWVFQACLPVLSVGISMVWLRDLFVPFACHVAWLNLCSLLSIWRSVHMGCCFWVCACVRAKIFQIPVCSFVEEVVLI